MVSGGVFWCKMNGARLLVQRVCFADCYRELGHQTGKEVKGEDRAFKKHPRACFELVMVMVMVMVVMVVMVIVKVMVMAMVEKTCFQ